MVSKILAEPTIIDLGLGLRAAVFRGLLGTACASLIPLALTDPIIETGRATFVGTSLVFFVSEALERVVPVVVDIGVAGLVLLVRTVKPVPRERFRDSCTLNMSSCIEERSLAGVPKLFDLLGGFGLTGVEGKPKDAVVAVLGRE